MEPVPGMKIPPPRIARRARIEIIPLIDIMFFLLATFVMVSLSMVKNQGLPVKLPVASTSAPQDRKDYTSITINDKGEFFFNKEPVSRADLGPRLQALKAAQDDPKIFINGDGKTEFDNVVAVLDETRKAGISKVAIETRKPERHFLLRPVAILLSRSDNIEFPVMRSRSIPFWISAFIHFAVIGAATVLLIKPPEFAMDTGHNSVEVSLVAAPPDPVPPPPPVPAVEPQEPVETQPPKPDDLTVPVTRPVPPVPVPPPEQPKIETPPPLPLPVPPKPHLAPTIAKGDGSAPKPGKDAVTASSDGGAIMDAKPDYLSNPPPIYPESSRQEKQEGVVVLEVIINAEGHPDDISIQTSSGFAPLDQSAVTAVRKWRFRPASLGSIKVKSRVMIPVRFRLDN